MISLRIRAGEDRQERAAEVGYACPQQQPTGILLHPRCTKSRRRQKIPEILANADVAQLVEHFTRNEGVPGSSPGVGLRKPSAAVRELSQQSGMPVEYSFQHHPRRGQMRFEHVAPRVG